jgi:hypothetical protein
VELEEKRANARTRGRITFDCFHCQQVAESDRCRCSLGHSLMPSHTSGTVSALQVLRGIHCSVCLSCAEFDNGGSAGG